MTDQKDDHKSPVSTPLPQPNLTLAPDTTAAGIVERALMYESQTPDERGYDEKVNFEGMHDMRQALDNRLKDPTRYLAHPRADVFGIL